MKYLLGEKLNFDWKVATVTIVSTLLLIVDHYYTFTAHKYWDRLILYLVIPLLLIIHFVSRKPKRIWLFPWRLEIGADLHRAWHSFHGSRHLLSGKRQRGHENLLREAFARLAVDNLS